MFEITGRQKSILEKIIEEYVGSAEPVSSQNLFQKNDFGVCPATLRIEMERLERQGFLEQPFVSAGRVPTDKAYRFWVDQWLEKEGETRENEVGLSNELSRLEEEMADSLNFFHGLTKRIAEITSGLAVSYLPEKKWLLKEGWGQIAKEPEFSQPSCWNHFIELVESWEQEVLTDSRAESLPKLRVWIGRENPYSNAKDFGAIAGQCFFPDGSRGVVAIFGPKRMDYQKSIKVINSLTAKDKDGRKTRRKPSARTRAGKPGRS